MDLDRSNTGRRSSERSVPTGAKNEGLFNGGPARSKFRATPGVLQSPNPSVERRIHAEAIRLDTRRNGSKKDNKAI